MLVKKLIPLKFLALMIQIILSSLLLATRQIYPQSPTSTPITFIIGCILIIFFSFIQVIFTFSGINVYNLRIHFQNMVFNWFAAILLTWYSLAAWSKDYVWYIWGFLCIYPLLNEVLGMISVICHSKKMIFQKYRSQQ